MFKRGCNEPSPLQEAEVLGAVHLLKLHLFAHPASGVQDASTGCCGQQAHARLCLGKPFFCSVKVFHLSF